MKRDLCQIKKTKELGASLVEYGLLVALVALIAVPSMSRLGINLSDKFDDVNQEIGSSDIYVP